MKDYIERAAAMESILGLTIVDTAVAQYANAVYYHLQNLPTAEVAEVVRCKNCFYYKPFGECNNTGSTVKPDDYCSYGARMDKEDEHEVSK